MVGSTLISLSFVVWLLVLMSTVSSNRPIVEARNGGVMIELIHHESPLSPFYNSSETNQYRMRKAIIGSMSRWNDFHKSSSLEPKAIQSVVSPNGGAYLMKLSIGTPPIEILAIADTGSDLVWTQCAPCEDCYQQDSPIFNSQQSSTYKELPCDSNFCTALGGLCNMGCQYSYYYGDQSYTYGVVASETLTFDSSNGQAVAVLDVAFGCGHDNLLIPRSSITAGIVGLGGGPLSLVSQLTSQFGGKFSYCLVPINEKASSKLLFGNEAIISGQGVVSTPLISEGSGTFYYVTLEGISVGDTRLDMQPAAANPGNIFIDSGTTLTFLDADLYSRVESAVKEAINLEPVPANLLCYNINDESLIPQMTFHFTGADLRLGPSNTFIKLEEDLYCFTMASDEQLFTPQAIIGNLNQVNFQVEYDLEAKMVSFAPADCTKY